MIRAALLLVFLSACGAPFTVAAADPAVDAADRFATSETAPPGSDGAALPDPHPDDGGAVSDAAADVGAGADAGDREAASHAAADAAADVVDEVASPPAGDAAADAVDEPPVQVRCTTASSCPHCSAPGAYVCCTASDFCGCTFTPSVPSLCN